MPATPRPTAPSRHDPRRDWPLVVALISVVACDTTAPERREPPIAFAAESGDPTRRADIYLRDVNGEIARPLVERVGGDFTPSWSPDGRRVAFAGTSSVHLVTDLRIFVVDADGSNLRALTDATYLDYGPAWSPDSERIAFYRRIDPSTWGLAIMNADGSNLVQVPNTSNAMFARPIWSPDGTHLAYSGQFDNTYAIWVVRTDGSDRIRLTSGSCSTSAPAWSPDGSRIAYDCATPTSAGLQLVNADGTGLRQLTSGLTDVQPTWSPDGGEILFTRWRDITVSDRTTDLYVVDLATGEIRSLGETPLDENNATWRPTP